MSLNKLTTSSDYLKKQYLNIGCNDIKCSSLEIGGTPVNPSNVVSSGKYDATMVASVAGTSTTNGWVYWFAVGNQLRFTFSRIIQLTANPSSINFTIDLPTEYTAVPNISGSGTAYITDGARQCDMTVSGVDATGAKITIYLVGQNTLTPGTTYLNGSLIVEI